jgi:hypothetical protein
VTKEHHPHLYAGALVDPYAAALSLSRRLGRSERSATVYGRSWRPSGPRGSGLSCLGDNLKWLLPKGGLTLSEIERVSEGG